jgi:hypothetical protein
LFDSVAVSINPAEWRIAHVLQEMRHTDRAALDLTLDGDVELRSIETQIEAAAEARDGIALADACKLNEFCLRLTSLGRCVDSCTGATFATTRT